MVSVKRAMYATTVLVSLYGLAYGYGSAFQDAPPAESPYYGKGYPSGKAPGDTTMKSYSSSTKKKGDRNKGDLGGPPSGGSMGGSSSGGR